MARGDLPKISVRVYSGSDTSGSLVRTSQVIADRAGNWSVEDGTPLVARHLHGARRADRHGAAASASPRR